MSDPRLDKGARTVNRSLCLTASLALALIVVAVAVAAVPSPALFKSGYDKCKITTLSALSKTTGVKFTKAKFYGKQCIWSNADGSDTIVFDTHPAGYLEYMVPKPGREANGDATRRVAVPGASKALLETHSFAATKRHNKDLFAAYAPGVVQVSMSYVDSLPDARVIAVMRLLTHT
jgi:hypothetical protein